MAALLIFALLFIFGLLNSLFFPPSKLLLSFRSLLRSAIFYPKSKPKPTKSDLKTETKVMRSDSHNESLNIRTVFATFDTDGDGYISAAELSDSLRRLGLHATGCELMAMMERVDANGDGLIDLNEFSVLYASMGGSPSDKDPMNLEEADRELREAFDVFDGNGDGLVTAMELSSVLKSLGLRQGDCTESCREMINMVDLDGDGMVNFEEFKKMMAVNLGSIF